MGESGRFEGFTLVETLMSVVVLSTVFISVFALLNFNISATRISRENTRATQILLDKMECLRLYQWQQLTNPAVLLTTFTNFTCDSTNLSSTNAAGQGIQYYGNITVTTPVAALSGTTYRSNLALVTVTVTWNSGNTNLTHTRNMSTYFSRLGVENLVQSN